MGSSESKLEHQGGLKVNQINFLVNGKEFSVSPGKSPLLPSTTLLDFIRDNAGLKGVKWMCREGGCGACLVSVKTKDPTTGADRIRSINSCLTPLLSCDGWAITTSEGTGNSFKGHSDIQKRIVSFGGSQCGFCTPGMVMNMHSLLNSKSPLLQQDVEDNFDGNICRCTGYRPIMDAFKTFAADAPPHLLAQCKAIDIEECDKIICSKNANNLDHHEDYEITFLTSPLHLTLENDEEWVKPTSLNLFFEIIEKLKESGKMYRLIGGNTANGVYRDKRNYTHYIDINAIPELTTVKFPGELLSIGAGTTITDVIEFLLKASKISGFKYTLQMANHWKRVANRPVRNAATIGGNLMIKHVHNKFPSDIFTVLEGIGASLNVALAPSIRTTISLTEFLTTPMTYKIILSINLPPRDDKTFVFQSYKISKRFQNAHAAVNAAFLFNIDKTNDKFKILETPRIIYGGINPAFVHAIQTEEFLIGKNIADSTTLKGAIDNLTQEMSPDSELPSPPPEYRSLVAKSLLYKTFLSVLGPKATEKVQSGGKGIERKLTSGKQIFDSDEKQWPLYQPVNKLEGLLQASGEAEYINDIHPLPNELFGHFVLSSIGKGTLQNMDASAALESPNVIAFITAKDIPGENDCMNDATIEELFASKDILYNGQPLGLIVASNRDDAIKAAKLIKVSYANIQKPVLTIPSTKNGQLSQEHKNRFTIKGKLQSLSLNGNEKLNDNIRGIKSAKGEFRIGSQYHHHMENQTCLVVPKEGGEIDVFASTQAMSLLEGLLTKVLKMPNHKINVNVRRLGGGFGAKITRCGQTAAAAAVAAVVTGRPVRVVLDQQTNMRMVGKRLPYYAKYSADFDENGKIVKLEADVTCDPGFTSNETTSFFSTILMRSCYNTDGWDLNGLSFNTNTPGNTWTRSPGSTQGIAIIETIMEHIAAVLNKDPLQVRLANLATKDNDNVLEIKEKNTTEDRRLAYGNAHFQQNGENPIPKMIEDVKKSSDYSTRKAFIETFNATNRWKKRGISIIPMRYPISYGSHGFSTFVSIYTSDGSVAISHTGIEMGQGINTKVAQVAAHELGIPLAKIKVKPANNLTGANSSVTGGATSSELVAYSTTQTCQILLNRLEGIKKKLGPTAGWEKIIQEAGQEGIDLTATYRETNRDGLKGYAVWGVNVTEVEIDILTGEHKIVRVDLLEDAGQSLSPQVDIGQIEGALVMGLGLWTTENIIHDPETGRILTDRTWEYKPPLLRDIPEDMRITMLQNTENPFGVLRSKATGEPPLCIAVGIVFAMRDAINSARKDAGNSEYYELNGPVTPQDILNLSLTTPSQYGF